MHEQHGWYYALENLPITISSKLMAPFTNSWTYVIGLNTPALQTGMAFVIGMISA